jgi:hypothetical protein
LSGLLVEGCASEESSRRWRKGIWPPVEGFGSLMLGNGARNERSGQWNVVLSEAESMDVADVGYWLRRASGRWTFGFDV